MTEAPNRAPEIRKDPIHNRWVIFSPARSRRPSDFKAKSNDPNPNSNSSECPFCINHEHECAPEIFRVPPETSDWKIRVIQNLYPALSRDLIKTEPGNGEGGVADVAAVRGFGFHDVVIESPVHSVHLMDLSPVQVGDVLLAYKKRIQQLQGFDSIKYVQVFKNHGASAGASMSHSHSQIIALPIVPPLISARIDGMKDYFKRTGKCALCEEQSNELLINESSHFISIAPLASTWPFEIWIIPRDHSSHFHELDTDKAIDLGGLLKLILRKISLQLNNPPFNFMIHTSPLRIDPSHLSYAHWFIQIIPQLSTVGGFELGTGCHINPVFPEDAAKVLREMGHKNLLQGVTSLDGNFPLCSPLQMIEPQVNSNPSSPLLMQVEHVIRRSSRKSNFSIEEDILLVSAWLNVGSDSVSEIEPRHKRYWDRMHQFFHTHKKFPSQRNQNSLSHRWSAIQLATRKFCACYAEVDCKQQRDKTVHNKILDAKQLYRECHKSPFQFEHCWNELRHQPKWIEEYQKKKLKQSKDISPSSSSPSFPSASPSPSFQSASPSPSFPTSISLAEDNHPNEIFSSKEMMLPSTTTREEKLNERDNKVALAADDQDLPSTKSSVVGMKEGKRAIHEEKMKYLELEQEERIMSTDFSNMSAIQAEYFRRRQLEIMKKRNWM